MERAARLSPQQPKGGGPPRFNPISCSVTVKLKLLSFCLRRSRRQDVKHGDPLRQCRGFNAKGQRIILMRCSVSHTRFYWFLFLFQAVFMFLFYLCSGETPERDNAVRGGGQQHLPGVSASLPSSLGQVALPEGGKEESGEEKPAELTQKKFCFGNYIIYISQWEINQRRLALLSCLSRKDSPVVSQCLIWHKTLRAELRRIFIVCH